MTDADPRGPDVAAEAEFREHHLTVPRTARYRISVADGAPPRRIWVALHGYGQLAASFARRCAPLVAPGVAVVVPEALSRFYVESADGASHARARVGASWMTREDRLAEIGDYLAYLDLLRATVGAELGAPDAELCILGFSQGTATASRWAAHVEAPPRRVVLWAGGLADDAEAAALAARLAPTPLDIVVGEHDALVPLSAVEVRVEALRACGVAVRLHRFGGGHQLHTPTLHALAAP